MAKYRKTYPHGWRDEKVRQLLPLEKLVFWYCVTGPQTNRCGLAYFSITTASEDLGIEFKQTAELFRRCRLTFSWHFDEHSKVLFLPSWWKHNRPENAKSLAACLVDLEELPHTRLMELFRSNVTHLSGKVLEHFQRWAESTREQGPELFRDDRLTFSALTGTGTGAGAGAEEEGRNCSSSPPEPFFQLVDRWREEIEPTLALTPPPELFRSWLDLHDRDPELAGWLDNPSAIVDAAKGAKWGREQRWFKLHRILAPCPDTETPKLRALMGGEYDRPHNGSAKSLDEMMFPGRTE